MENKKFILYHVNKGSYIKQVIKNIFKTVLILFIFFGAARVCAAGIELNSVTLSPQDDSYRVTLNTDKVPKYNKKVKSNDVVYFEIKNAIFANGVKTIYKDVKNINSVVIQQISKDKVRIYLNAKGAKDAKLFFRAQNVTIEGQDRAQNLQYALSSAYNKVSANSVLLLCSMLIIGSLFAIRNLPTKIKMEDDAKMFDFQPQIVYETSLLGLKSQGSMSNPYSKVRHLKLKDIQKTKTETSEVLQKRA